MPHHPVAFRCKTCGHLERAEHAGEDAAPHACSACGKGVWFTHDLPKLLAELKAENGDHQFRVVNPMPGYYKVIDPFNWEVLADCTPERLAELGLEPHHCTRHVPTQKGQPGREPQHLTATANDGLGSRDSA